MPLQSPSPLPPCHIPASWSALHILASNTLHLRYSSNDPQRPPPLVDLAINIPRESRDMGPVRDEDFTNDKYRGLFLHCHHFRAHTRHSGPAGRRWDQCSQPSSPSVLSPDEDGRLFAVPSRPPPKLPDDSE